MNLLERQKEFYLKQNALQIGTILTELQGLELQFKVVDETQIPLATQVQSKTLQGFLAGKVCFNRCSASHASITRHPSA